MNRISLCMTDIMACHRVLNLFLHKSGLVGLFWRIPLLHLSKHITHQKHFTAKILWSNVHLHIKRELTCSASNGGPLCAFLNFSPAGISCQHCAIFQRSFLCLLSKVQMQKMYSYSDIPEYVAVGYTPSPCPILLYLELRHHASQYHMPSCN